MRIADINRYLNVRMAHSPSFAAEEPRVLFVMNLTGSPQVWVMDREGGWPDPLTLHDDRVLTLAAAPHGPWIIVGHDQGGNERQQLAAIHLETRERIELTTHPDALYEFGAFFSDGERLAYTATERNGRDFDLYLGHVRGGPPTFLQQCQGSWHVAGVSPEDDRLLLVERVTPSHQRVFLFDLETRTMESLTPEAWGAARYQFVAFGRDEVLALSDYGADTLQLVRLVPRGRAPEVLRAFDWDIEELAVSPDGQLVAYAVNDEGYSVLHVLNRATGRDRIIEGLPPGVVGGLVFSPDGLWLGLHHSGPQHTHNVFVVELHQQGTEDRLVEVTHASLGGLLSHEFIVPELVHCPTFDGRTIPSWFYRPKGHGPYPVVVSVHGGPESQERPAMNPIYQYWLAEGFGVLAPNVRGSTGYGKAYSHLDDGPKRVDAIRDLEAVAGWLRQRPDVLGDKLAVYGGSYGGYMVLAALTWLPGAYAAGVDIVGIANLETLLENTGPWRRALREAEYGSLATDRESLRTLSPIHRADKIQVPLMVIHGQNDPRVPVGEAEQIVAALKAREARVEYLLFEDEGHGIVKLKNRRVMYPAVTRFLKEVLEV